MFHINTQIPWHRLGPARVYTGTTAAFHDTRPLSPPPPLHLRLSFVSSTLPSCITTDTTARGGRGPSSGLFTSRGPQKAHSALSPRTVPLSHTPSIGRATSVSLSIGLSHLALRARRHRMLSRIARSFLTRVSAKGLLFLVLPCDLPPWVLCTSTSSSFYTVTVLCLFLLLFVPFPISFSTSFLLFVVYHFYLSSLREKKSCCNYKNIVK